MIKMNDYANKRLITIEGRVLQTHRGLIYYKCEMIVIFESFLYFCTHFCTGGPLKSADSGAITHSFIVRKISPSRGEVLHISSGS